MNKPIAIAAILATLTVGVHVFLASPSVIELVRASALPQELQVVLRVVWHGISVTLAGIAAGLWWLTTHRNLALTVALSGVQVAFAALFIGFGLGQLGSLATMPQWVVFLLIPALTFWGVRRQS